MTSQSDEHTTDEHQYENKEGEVRGEETTDHNKQDTEDAVITHAQTACVRGAEREGLSERTLRKGCGIVHTGDSVVDSDTSGPESVEGEDMTTSAEDAEYTSLLATRGELAEHAFEIPYSDLTIMEELGEGFFGKVHKAKFRQTIVAVKKITRSNFREKSDLDLFQKEILIMSKIQNKNCVLFVGLCTDPQNRCIVSEYCGGGNLRELLDKPYLLTPALRLRIACDIAAGMRYLHSWNPPIIHRDLTSNNILLSKNFDAKIADFGLSRERNDAMTTAVGSLSYMAPEAFLGLPYNETVDVYSFGQLLYELVSGNPPHHGMNTQRFAFLVALEDYRQSLGGFTKGMQDLIQMCWQRAPERRPSFSVVLAAIEKLTESDFVRDPNYQSSGETQNPQTTKTPTHKNPLQRSNSSHIPSRSNSNISMASPAQSSDPDDAASASEPSSSPSRSSPSHSSPSSPSINEPRRALSTSTERDGSCEGSDPPSGGAHVNPPPTRQIVYSNYSTPQEEETGKYGYYCESSTKSFSYVTDDIDILACPCLSSKQCSDCTILQPPVSLEGHKNTVRCLSGDGSQNDFVASCSEDCTIRVWPITETCKQKQGVLTHNTATTAVQGVRLGPKNTPFLVSGDTRGDLVLWELRHFKSIRTIKQGHSGAVTNFAWGGTRLVSSGRDAVVKLWDLEKGVCASSFTGHTKQVNDVHCDHNQVLIVSSSDDGTIKLWDSRIGKDFRTLRVHTGDAVVCAKMRSTGRDNILVSGSDTGQVAVWDMHAPYCITTHTRAARTAVCDIDFDNELNVVFAAYADGSATVIETNSWKPCHEWRFRDVHASCMVVAQHSVVMGFADGKVMVTKINHERT